jgi:hypothetical protein
MESPNVENLFLAGGVAFFFDPGTGERDLGLIEEPPEVEAKSTEVKVYGSRSGKRRLLKTFSTEEDVTWNFKLQEAIAANMQAFFKGGPLEVIGAGTDTETDQKLTLTGEVPVPVGKYGISAVTVRQFLDEVLVGDASGDTEVFVDNTAAADSLDGTPFDTLIDENNALYLGKDTPFGEIYIDFAVPGSYGAVVWKYWNGSTWAILGTAGDAKDLDADGKVNWTPPVLWAKNTMNGKSYYRLKVTATTPWTTPATINEIRQNAVKNTDYIVDPGQAEDPLMNGRIGRLAAGFLADGEEVKVSYTYITWASLRFAVVNDQYQQGAARIQFRPLNGLQWNYIVPKCQLKPNGKMTFDDKKVLEVPMTMEVLDAYDTTPDAPYGYWECLNET